MKTFETAMNQIASEIDKRIEEVKKNSEGLKTMIAIIENKKSFLQNNVKSIEDISESYNKMYAKKLVVEARIKDRNLTNIMNGVSEEQDLVMTSLNMIKNAYEHVLITIENNVDKFFLTHEERKHQSETIKQLYAIENPLLMIDENASKGKAIIETILMKLSSIISDGKANSVHENTFKSLKQIHDYYQDKRQIDLCNIATDILNGILDECKGESDFAIELLAIIKNARQEVSEHWQRTIQEAREIAKKHDVKEGYQVQGILIDVQS